MNTDDTDRLNRLGETNEVYLRRKIKGLKMQRRDLLADNDRLGEQVKAAKKLCIHLEKYRHAKLKLLADSVVFDALDAFRNTWGDAK